MQPANLVKLQAAFEPYNPRHRMAKPPTPFTREDAESGRFKNIYLQTDLGQLDCLGDVKGIGGYDTVLQRSVELDMQTFRLRVIALDALIEAKEAMGRPRDLENVKILRAIQERQATN
ncbi:hypothetical protein [Cerasicoccus maritimus]|uniref:hypothetical protein n=1 Tax=Cerasicoccus maritimus TaxID=490089 RepID=UPI002852A2D1|nr:hypothetical protein [Cerasicoccus maritimus]